MATTPQTQTPAAPAPTQPTPASRPWYKVWWRVLFAIFAIFALVSLVRWGFLTARGQDIVAPVEYFDEVDERLAPITVRAQDEGVDAVTLKEGECVRITVDPQDRWEWNTVSAAEGDRNVTAAGGAHRPLDLKAVQENPSLAERFFAPTERLGALLARVNDRIAVVGHSARVCSPNGGTLTLVQNREKGMGAFARGEIIARVSRLRN